MHRLLHTCRSLVWGAILASAAAAASAGTCIEVESPGPVQLPDGRRFEAHTIRLCPATPFTPSTSIVEVRIDGVGIGRYLAEFRADRAPRSWDPPFVVFDRLGSDRPYRLVSVTVPGGGRSVSHHLWRTVESLPTPARASHRAPRAAGNEPAVETIAVAARVR